jgi:hypothetical protein
VKALERSAAVFGSIARSAAILGISGSTAREKMVDAKTTRLTILRMSGTAGLVGLKWTVRL